MYDYYRRVMYEYLHIPDDVQVPKDNSVMLSSLSKDARFLVTSNLQTPGKNFVSKET